MDNATKDLIGKFYVYEDEDGSAISVAQHGTGPQGGWVGVHIAKMPIPDKNRTREQINECAALIVTAVNQHAALLRCAEALRGIIDIKSWRHDDAELGHRLVRAKSALSALEKSHE